MAYPSESLDADAVLMARDYAHSIRVLGKDPRVVSLSREAGMMTTGKFHSRTRLLGFHLLDPAAFSGTNPGDDFYDYVARYGSILSPIGRVSTVPTVWYMRLAIEGEAWTAQVGKILREVRSGAPWTLYQGVAKIAQRFGLRRRTAERWRIVQDSARRAGLLDWDARD